MALSKFEVEKLLKSEICYLATADKKGNPHVKPIWFVYYEGKIWFETDYSTKSFRNIKHNNRVMICFGGRETYLIWGKVKWYDEKKASAPFRKLLWEKYGDDMNDSYITEKTGIFEVIIDKEMSWHYADNNWE